MADFPWPFALGAGPFERLLGLRGMDVLVGDPGRLLNVLVIGVIGVLDGRSIGTAKFRNSAGGDMTESPFR